MVNDHRSLIIEAEIKELRIACRMSQEQLAEKAQVSVRTIQRLEAGDDASISTLNLVAGALGVEVGNLFPHTDATQEQQAKIQSADEQLQYQLQSRHEEFRTFKHLYTAIFIIVMMAWGALFPLVHNDIYSLLMGTLWIGAWIMMGPLKKWLVIKKVDPKLDHKFPLTASRVDKDK